MAIPKAVPTTETTLTLRRTYPASREKIFQAWTDPQALSRWFAPSPAHRCAEVVADLRVGGRYRIDMRTPEGHSHPVGGVYREIRAPERLVFTWRWEKPEMDEGETIVTVQLYERGAATEMELTHELSTVESRDKHAWGWNGCLAGLSEYFGGTRKQEMDREDDRAPCVK
jgi:uncharacterized protein YndB with AHSA1/START domain